MLKVERKNKKRWKKSKALTFSPSSSSTLRTSNTQKRTFCTYIYTDRQSQIRLFPVFFLSLSRLSSVLVLSQLCNTTLLSVASKTAGLAVAIRILVMQYYFPLGSFKDCRSCFSYSDLRYAILLSSR
jgi:hypothetical protein